MPLSPNYTLRHPTLADLIPVHDLTRTVDLAEIGEADNALDELRIEWKDLDLAADAWVIAAPNGDIVSYATLAHDNPNKLTADVFTHPDHLGRGLGTAINRAVEARAAEFLPSADPAAPVTLATYINGTSTVAPPLLTHEGYQIVRHYWRMAINLDAPPPAPAWPDGITPHTFIPGQDDARTHATIEDAFADMWNTSPVPFAEWHSNMIDRPDFDPTLWTLALDGDDEVAGACLCYHFPERGWIRNLGIRRRWRRRGLALALIHHTFGLFWARGEHHIGLGVDAASPTGATHLYERAGMRATRTYLRWEKAPRTL